MSLFKNKMVLLFTITVLLLGFSYFLSFKNATTTAKQTQEPVNQINTSNSIACSEEAIPESTEGPYYKSGSPERNLIYNGGTAGTKIALTGYVLDTSCKPLANVWLDFWQADGNGNYDNEGYNLRGHQFTDSEGRYKLETKMPGEYPGRTAHIHVKLRATQNSKIYTTQLYFPTSMSNSSDSIFNDRLLVDFNDEEKRQAKFDFVIETE